MIPSAVLVSFSAADADGNGGGGGRLIFSPTDLHYLLRSKYAIELDGSQ